VPAFDDSSGVIADRFVVLKMAQSFLGREDTRLEGDLLAELPGIFLWALRGLDRLVAQGHLTSVASTDEHVQQMRHSASPLTAFLDAKCDVGDPAFRVVKDEVWDAWRVWCRDNEEACGSRIAFGRALVANVPGLVTTKMPADERGHRPNAYGGLQLRRDCQSPGCDQSGLLCDDAGWFGWCSEHLPRGAS
jgi:putative DNA primase/helicase